MDDEDRISMDEFRVFWMAIIRYVVRLGWGLLRLSRPILWPVAIVPFLGGYVLATHRIVPKGCIPVDILGCFSNGWRFGVVLCVMGPMCWLFAFLINDIVDLPGDRNDPSRATSPLVTNAVPLAVAVAVAIASAAVGLVAGIIAGPVFALMAVVALVISWIYSVPPVRLKNRPGFDIAACSLAVGACPVVVGYTLGQPLLGMPWIIPAVGTLYMVAIYVPTTIGDYEADLDSGNITTAVRFGRDATYAIGLVAIILASIAYAVLAALDYIIPRKLLIEEIFVGTLVIIAYHLLFYKMYDAKTIVYRLAILSAIVAVSMAAFGSAYLGLW